MVLAGALLLMLGAPATARAERSVPVVVEPSTPAVPEVPRIETPAATFVPGLVLELDAANGGERPGFSMHRARLSLDAEVDRLQGLGGFLRLGVGEGDVPSPLLDAVLRFRVVGAPGACGWLSSYVIEVITVLTVVSEPVGPTSVISQPKSNSPRTCL